MSNSVGQLSYGSFYLPTVAFGYLSTNAGSPLFQHIPHIQYLNEILDPIGLFYFLTALSFISAIQFHGIARAIYGPDGPSSRPKHEIVQVRHTLAIILNEEGAKVPIIPCRIANEGILRELLEYTVYRGQKSLYESQPEIWEEQRLEKVIGPVPSQHRLEVGVQQFRNFIELLTWWKLPRILFFAPMLFHTYLTWISLASLIVFAIYNSVNYALLLLILAQIVLLTRGIVWSFVPSPYNVEDVQDRFTPEYEIEREDEK
jgi:hypothetical protein